MNNYSMCSHLAESLFPPRAVDRGADCDLVAGTEKPRRDPIIFHRKKTGAKRRPVIPEKLKMPLVLLTTDVGTPLCQRIETVQNSQLLVYAESKLSILLLRFPRYVNLFSL